MHSCAEHPHCLVIIFSDENGVGHMYCKLVVTGTIAARHPGTTIVMLLRCLLWHVQEYRRSRFLYGTDVLMCATHLLACSRPSARTAKSDVQCS
eukprot:6192264-Pleurochrysis_carterae.AAC.2